MDKDKGGALGSARKNKNMWEPVRFKVEESTSEKISSARKNPLFQPIRFKVSAETSGRKSSSKRKSRIEPVRFKVNEESERVPSARKTLNFQPPKNIISITKSLAPTPLVVKPTIRKKLRFTAAKMDVSTPASKRVTFKVPEIPKITITEAPNVSTSDATTQTEANKSENVTKPEPTENNDLDEFLLYESKLGKHLLYDKLDLLLSGNAEIAVKMSEIQKDISELKIALSIKEKENTPPKMSPRPAKHPTTPAATNFTPKPPSSKLRETISKYNLMKSEFSGILGTPNFDVNDQGISVKFQKKNSYSTALLQQLHMLENTPCKK